MYQEIFDSHAHYDDPAFDSDRDALLERLFSQDGVCGIINAGSSLESSRRALQLANRYPALWCAVGVHPDSAAQFQEQQCSLLADYCRHPKVVAIGEIGLDYHYDDGAPPQVQRAVFARQLELAVELNLPVIVHDRDAHQDTLELLRKYRPRGVLHCYSGSAEMVREVAALGFYLGFTGVVTFKKARRALEAACVVPEDRLLIETDCPYMAPEPNRGRRCDSSMLAYTGARLAELRGIPVQELFYQTARNARQLFGL